MRNDLQVEFSGDRAQIEVGGPYAGIEMHNSAPALNRISFYYPRANSVDVSQDYWKREKYRIMDIGIRFGDQLKRWIGTEPFDFTLTPCTIHLVKKDSAFSMMVDYRFCKDCPAFTATYEITNQGPESVPCELFLSLDLSLRTCHSYKIKDEAWTEYDSLYGAVFANFEDPETGNAQIFVANAGLIPCGFTTAGDGSTWMDDADLPGTIFPRENPGHPAAGFVYRKTLGPGESMKVVQIIGSILMGKGRDGISYLVKHHEKETRAYEAYVLDAAYGGHHLETGDDVLDHSVHWSKAILAANAHVLDGMLVPMPCPAQYNFYFTHDVLLTDLAAVFFDTHRVKRDLEFIIQHADSLNTIPHAYYWRDDRYVTEYALSDNWNHFWFTLVSARYLRHTGDAAFLENLYPYIERSIRLALENLGEDDLMWAYRPDWWDIGSSFGQRSYMTILTIRVLEVFNYISTVLGKDAAPGCPNTKRWPPACAQC